MMKRPDSMLRIWRIGIGLTIGFRVTVRKSQRTLGQKKEYSEAHA